MNLNTLFNKLTNFKIRFTKDPSPIEISNKEIIFVIGGNSRSYDLKRIELNRDMDTVEITLEWKGE